MPQPSLVVHLCKRDFRHHGVLGECAAAHEVEQALASWKSGGPFWHQAFTLREPAEFDYFTLWNVQEYDRVSWRSKQNLVFEFIHISFNPSENQENLVETW